MANFKTEDDRVGENVDIAANGNPGYQNMPNSGVASGTTAEGYGRPLTKH